VLSAFTHFSSLFEFILAKENTYFYENLFQRILSRPCVGRCMMRALAHLSSDIEKMLLDYYFAVIFHSPSFSQRLIRVNLIRPIATPSLRFNYNDLGLNSSSINDCNKKFFSKWVSQRCRNVFKEKMVFTLGCSREKSTFSSFFSTR
jgi:hypothetical protein